MGLLQRCCGLCCSSYESLCCCAIVSPKFEFQFGLESVENPIRIIASAERCLDVLVFTVLIIVGSNRHTGP